MADLRTAAQQALEALDKSLYMNDYCGLEVSKHDQPDVTDAIEALRAALAEPTTAQQVVSEQAEDEGLWFVAATASEAYLQQALRRLHAAVEGEDDQDAD